jgi:hypothetical protein
MSSTPGEKLTPSFTPIRDEHTLLFRRPYPGVIRGSTRLGANFYPGGPFFVPLWVKLIKNGLSGDIRIYLSKIATKNWYLKAKY